MIEQNKISRFVLNRLELLKKSFTPSLWLPIITGALVLIFTTLSLLQSNPGSFSDELGFTGDNDVVTIEGSAPQKTPLVMREEVRAGQSLYTILLTKGLSPTDIDGITKQLKGKFSIRALRAGNFYETAKKSDGTLQRLSFAVDRTTTIHIEKENGNFHVRREVEGYETKVASLEGSVTKSLSHTLQSSKRSALLNQIKPLFSEKIDFRHDIRPGTKYRILFEEKWLKNEFITTGKVLAVELSLPNRICRAYLYTDKNGKSGYFDENGSGLERTALFSSPCNYSHISSGFGYRIHPLTRTMHFHGGVDMVATTGTPVRAVASGNIIFRGRKGEAGNMITLTHSGGYYSQYLHLSRYAPNIASSARVQQGEIIGYVGSTGSSTGSHLDFRIIHNGKPLNPIGALASSTSGSISRSEMGNFMASISAMKARLDNNRVLVAGRDKRSGEAIL